MTLVDKDGFGPENLSELASVSRETLSRIETVIGLLDDWRTRHNLIGPNEMGQIWRRHVWDSLQLLPHVSMDSNVVDLGSGAGFPGLILSATMIETGGHLTMVESVGKKCAFLRAAIEAANLPASVHQGRVEASGDIPASCVTARAFAPLPKLLDYAAPWLERGAVAVLPKGNRWEDELTKAKESWKFAYDVIPSQSGDGVILKISEVSRGGS